MTIPPAMPHNFAQVHARLGNVPLNRIRVQPPPGAASEADLLRPENRFCELVDGILVEKPAVGWRESFLAHVLGHFITQFVLAGRLGIVAGADLPVRMQAGNVRMPDVAYYSWSRLANQSTQEPALTVSPDLAVEVLSPSNTAQEMQRKREEYFASGCRLVWEVESELRLVRVYTSATEFTLIGVDGTLSGEPVLPGFQLVLRDLFTALETPASGEQP